MTKLSFYHLLDANQIKESDIEKLIKLATIYHKKKSNSSKLKNSILATLFFEPSTRTRFSFESAMYRLGGNVISMEHGNSSSVKKGESLHDTGRTVSNYANIIVARHPEINSVHQIAKYSTSPVINAGDGSNQHPTQSLVDLFTIFSEKKRLDNLKIGIVGDLKYSRTVHSLMTLLTKYKNNQFKLIPIQNLSLDDYHRKQFSINGNLIEEEVNLEKAIKGLDILYLTRIQQERFEKKELDKIQNHYRIDQNLINQAKSDMIILHPLPRNDEIGIEIDEMPQAKYFAQVNYGVYMRMALLTLMLL